MKRQIGFSQYLMCWLLSAKQRIQGHARMLRPFTNREPTFFIKAVVSTVSHACTDLQTLGKGLK